MDFSVRVADWMSEPVVTVPAGAKLGEVHRAMRQAGVSCLPVVDAAGRTIGAISRTDLLRVGRREARGRGWLLELPDRTAADEMHAGAITVSPGAPLHVAARAMIEERVHRVFVVDEGRLVGVLSAHDLYAVVRDQRVMTPLADLVSRPVRTVPCSATIALATDALGEAGIHGLVVVDEGGWPVGIFSQEDGLWARVLPGETPVEEAMSYSMVSVHVHAPLFRAAAQAHATHARRVLAVDDTPPTRDACRVKGILTGLDLARAIAAAAA